MSIYDEIKSPVDNEENIKKILDIYVNGRVDSGTNVIKSGDDLYRRLVDYGGEQNDINEYLSSFYQYIEQPNLNKLYQNIRDININSYDEQVQALINIIETQQISEDDKNEMISRVHSKYLYPLAQFKSIINKYNSFEDIDRDYLEQNMPDIERILFNIDIYPSLKEKNLKKLQQYNLTEEQIENIKNLTKFRRMVSNKFSGRRGGNGIPHQSTNITIK